MEALTVINQMPATKSEIKSFAARVTESVTDGNVNALDLMIKLSAAQLAIKEIIDNIKSIATDEAMKYGKTFDHGNASVTVKQVGVKMDYSKCNDVVWATHYSEEKNAAEQRKDREQLLKTIKGQMTVVNEETGETWTIYEPSRSGCEQAVITINK